MSQALRAKFLPPMPANSLKPGAIVQPTVRARGGTYSYHHPVHVCIQWDNGDLEEVWGTVTEWNDEAMRVHLNRHGEGWYWFARADVRPCTATELPPGWTGVRSLGPSLGPLMPTPADRTHDGPISPGGVLS